MALRWLLDRPQVGAAIVGVSRTDRSRQNLAAFALHLDEGTGPGRISGYSDPSTIPPSGSRLLVNAASC